MPFLNKSLQTKQKMESLLSTPWGTWVWKGQGLLSNANTKIWIKTLRETNLSLVQALSNS